MTGAEGAAAAAAAEQARKRRQEEEEEASAMTTDPSGDVEYKIIRSATGAFKNPAKFRAALEQEALAGWDLVEKLDNARARLRRPVSCRENDATLSQDPYRINVGLTENAIAIWVLLGVFVIAPLVIAAIVGIVILLKK